MKFVATLPKSQHSIFLRIAHNYRRRKGEGNRDKHKESCYVAWKNGNCNPAYLDGARMRKTGRTLDKTKRGVRLKP